MRWTRVILLTVAMLGMSAVAWAELKPAEPATGQEAPAAQTAPAETTAAAAEATDETESTDEGLGIMALFVVFHQSLPLLQR